MELWPNQIDAIAKLRQAVARGSRRIVLQSPTGSGKTHVVTSIAKSTVEKGGMFAFLAPRRELIFQAHNRFWDNGVDAGVIMAGEPRNIYSRCQIASFDTLHHRAMLRDKIELPRATVLAVDEGHLALSEKKLDILNRYDDSIIIAVTATPMRSDGRGLGEFFDELVTSWSVRELIDAGFLVEPRYFTGSAPDLEEVALNRNGDYVGEQLGLAVDQPELIGDIVDNWERLASDRSTVVFATNIAHSRHLKRAFKDRGYTAEHLDAYTPQDQREEILRRVESGETQVLCNVYIATYGLDIPRLSCAVLARPTRHLGLYIQIGGRVLRIFQGKKDALILDHSGVIEEHGFLDDPVPWTLDSNVNISERKKKEREERRDPKEIACPACQYVFKGRRDCPMCGAQHMPEELEIPVYETDLVEVKKKGPSPEEKAEFFGGLLTHAERKNFSRGWAFHMYREKFKEQPDDRVRPCEPNAAVRGWITSRNIARARAREKANTA